ncbi:MAG: hypothetical protein Fur0037_04920 [Planctomycetota bacterium]
MTIYGIGYRRAEFAPEPAWRRLGPIASLEFRTIFRSRWGVALFLGCLAPSVVNLVVMLMAMGVLRVGDMQRRMAGDVGAQFARWIPDRIEFYVEPIVQESTPLFLVLTALVGCRAIAKDRSTNALELYWTRGIGPLGYFAAKWLGSFLLLAMVGIAGPLLVWLTGVFIAEDWGFLGDTIGIVPRALAAHAVFCGELALLAMAISGSVRSPNFASVTWLLLIAGTGALAGVLGEILRGHQWPMHLSLYTALSDLDRWIAGAPLEGASGQSALLASGGYVAVMLLLMARSMRRRGAVA